MITRRTLLAGMAAATVAGPLRAAAPPAGVTRIDPALDRIIAADAPVEVLGRGYGWAEGPVWIARGGGYLLFSDVPGNRVHRWTRATGVTIFLDPSGLQTPVPPTIREAGANGMALDRQGRLILADSGTRAIVRLDLATRRRTVLADRFEGKRFNSPNDVVVARDGAIYFTDPPYGLTDKDASPLREQAVNGVYRLAPDGAVTLIDGTLYRPNGIGLSPDGRTLYVARAEDDRPELLAYVLGRNGTATGRRVFRDMKGEQARFGIGHPDGMDVTPDGHVFVTGSGGVHVLTPDGALLGVISAGKTVANCCIGEGGRSLFMTASDMLCRVPLKH